MAPTTLNAHGLPPMTKLTDTLRAKLVAKLEAKGHKPTEKRILKLKQRRDEHAHERRAKKRTALEVAQKMADDAAKKAAESV
eukprot:3829878-Prymnesium_polylepis.1